MRINKEYLTLKEATEIFKYSSDYIGFLIRNKKIKGKRIYNNVFWRVHRKTIIEYCQKKKRHIEYINTKNSYISLKEAAIISGYNPDYIGHLIRNGKIEGKKVCFQASWLVNKNNLERYQTRKRNQRLLSGETIARIPSLVIPQLGRKTFNVAWRFALTAFIIFFFVSEFAPVKFLQGSIRAFFIEQTEEINFYNTECSGDWENPNSAQGIPDIEPRGNINSFSKSNSAIYKTGPLSLVCKNFDNNNFIDNESVYTFQSAKIKFSFAIGEKESDISIIEQSEKTQQEQTNQEPENNASSSEEQVSFWQRAKNFFQGLINEIAWKIKDWAGRWNYIAKAEEVLPADNNTETTEEIILEESAEVEFQPVEKTESTPTEPPTETGSLPTLEEETTTETTIIETTTPEATTTEPVITSEITTITTTLSNLDTRIIIWWSLDGENWQELDTISSYSLSNALNSGYFSYDAPFLKNWKDVKNLKIKFEGVIGGETNITAYLDSTWIEITHEEISEYQISLTPPGQPQEQSVEEQSPVPEEPKETLEEISGEIEESLKKEFTEEELTGDEVEEEKEPQVKKLPKIKIKENSLIFIDQGKEDFRSDEEPFFVIVEPDIALQELISSGEGELIEGEITQIDIPIVLATSTISATSTIFATSTIPTVSATSTTSTISATSTIILSTSTNSTISSTSSDEQQVLDGEEASISEEDENTEIEVKEEVQEKTTTTEPILEATSTEMIDETTTTDKEGILEKIGAFFKKIGLLFRKSIERIM